MVRWRVRVSCTVTVHWAFPGSLGIFDKDQAVGIIISTSNSPKK